MNAWMHKMKMIKSQKLQPAFKFLASPKLAGVILIVEMQKYDDKDYDAWEHHKG